MPTIADLLKRAQMLEPVSDTPRLDAEVLLCYVLDKPRSYLYAWPEYVLEQQAFAQFKDLFARRVAGEPIAHLSGQKEFWSLSLDVNASTLIPRPETELLVETALNLFDKSNLDSDAQVLDLGTGTGAIALALASERPNWNVLAVDSSADAVKLAESNRTRLDFDNVQIDQSDWFENVNADRRFDLIVSNPPYIAPDDRHLSEGDVRFEPRSALVANDAGFADIETIILNAGEFLVRGGWLLLEHGSEQGEGVRELLKAHLDDVTTWRDVAGLERVSGGRVPIGEV
ncbi:MAG: peptide chain release factor N(5)-glutamine methyltransferase [Porticoccaceae bacterium]